MALHDGKPLDVVRAMSEVARTVYFESYAVYFDGSSERPYRIQVGSKTLLSKDTYDLRQQFDELLGSPTTLGKPLEK